MSKSKSTIKFRVKPVASNFSEPLDYKIISDGKVNLTKARAFEFLECKTFQGERAVRENHVQFLFEEWASGRFIWHHVLLASARLSGELYRVNGQHTAWMRVNIPDSAEPVRADVREVVYGVDTEEHLRALYSAFDRNAVRSVGHISKVLLTGTDAAREIPATYLNKLTAGFRVFFSEDWNVHHLNPSP